MPQLVDRRPYPKNIFSRSDVETDQAENERDHAVSAVISEDAENFYLTTVWPSLDSLVGDDEPASVPQTGGATRVSPPEVVVQPAPVARATGDGPPTPEVAVQPVPHTSPRPDGPPAIPESFTT